ncbi:alkaline phosphatase family protein [Mucilaginibacter endophyticus]|uniref:alkaline phosphatase family protein n=1 Tax=Mucilaginibacter endophyticus TaxID=2675003 RepID=UPI000E0DEA0D|nr:ectonucleotide pyrophosphatase/phosphodiesterase [Mucilaginibacter endophyticus]
MKIFFKTLLFILAGTCTVWAQKPKYVVMISIDGFRPEFYKDPSWGAINLMEIAANGVYADGVRGDMPTVTYPSHTTIITGKYPAKHGVFYNTPFETADQIGELGYTDARRIKTETLWEAAHKKGLTTASVLWPVSVHAPVDYNMPDAARDTKLPDPLSPFRKYATPAGLFEELEQNATGKLYNRDLDGHLSTDDNLARMASYLIEKHKPNLITVHLVCVDHYAHAEGRMGPTVRKAVANIDRNIGSIIEATERAGIKDSTAFLIVGDHGFVNIHTQLAPNVWLAGAGLVGKNLQNGDWKAQFFQQGGTTFLYVKNNDQKVLKQVRTLLEQAPAPQRKLFRIIERKQLDELGADPQVSLALAAIPGVSFNNATDGNSLRSGSGGTHGHFPDFKEIETGFLAFGAGINNQKIIHQMGLEDIAPMVASLLDLQLTDIDGVLYPGILKQVKK